jgi:hypothetical protein
MTKDDDLNPDEDLLWRIAAHQILRGSTILHLWPAITKASQGESGRAWYRSNLEDILGLNDFDWPWYDEWMRVFQEKNDYPDRTFRYEFEPPAAPVEPLYQKKNDVLIGGKDCHGMTVTELRTLAKAHGIGLEGATKKEEIGKVLARKIQWDDVREWAEAKNKEHEQQTRINRIRAKQNLLSLMLVFRFYNLYRHWQIADLLRERTVTKRKPYLEIGPVRSSSRNRKFVREFIKDWKFDPNNRENLPPFFPGDGTEIRTKRA